MRSNVLLVVFICLMATLAQDPDIFSPQPIAECKPVRMVKNVQIRDATVNVDDLVPTLDRIVFILSERAAECGAECLSSVILQMTGSKVWSPIIIGIRKHDASIDSILAIPFQPRLLILQSRFDSDSGMSPHGWSFADILDANHYGERFSDRKFIGVRDRSQCDPSTLIYSQSLAHDVALPERSHESEYRDEKGQIEYLVPKKITRIILCVCHIVLFFIVGVFLTGRFVNNYLRDRWVRSFLLFALMAVSATHVVSYLFKLADVITTTLAL